MTVLPLQCLACLATFSRRCCLVCMDVSSCRSRWMEQSWACVYIMGASLLPVMRVSFRLWPYSSISSPSFLPSFVFLHYFACDCHSRSLFLSLLGILLLILHSITRSLLSFIIIPNTYYTNSVERSTTYIHTHSQ